jgi:hypothetical protein
MVIRCSGLARPMICAGSLFFEDLPQQETNAAAEEGTAAGEWLANILTGKHVGTHASNGVQFDNDMHFYTKPIADEINSNRQSEVLCEQRIDWQTRSGIWIKGSYDISFIRDGVLYIDDLKYGWGIVEVQENWQLLGYAIGEVIRRGVAFDKVVMRIHQPRPHHENGSTREWHVTYDALLAYKEKIEARCDAIAAGLNTLVTSEKCKYCPAAVACPAHSKSFFRGVEVAHEFTQDNIDEKELAFQLDLVARVSEVIKIKSDSLKALAVDRMKKGAIIPGYVNEQSYGDRKWKPGVSPESIKLMTGKDITETVMLSPAKAEKAGIPKEFVNQLVDRHFLGLKLIKRDAGKDADKIFNGGV